jgi:hypothetical protein
VSRTTVGFVAALTLTGALALGAVLGRPLSGQAQSSSAQSGAMLRHQGGVWVLHDGKLFVCDLEGARAASAKPPTPRCGEPLELP